MIIPNSTLTDAQRKSLVQSAGEVRLKAYAPYSNYQVGAALLTPSHNIFTGCNVENAAYPATICAERTAVVKAVSEGVRDFVACAVVTRDGGSPCGICRQVMFEFSPEMTIIMANEQGEITYEGQLKDMLLFGFGPSSLLGHK